MNNRRLDALISVKVVSEFKEELQEMANENNMTFPNYIRYILFQHIENSKKNK